MAHKLAPILGPSVAITASNFGERDCNCVVLGSPAYNGQLLPELLGFAEDREEWFSTRRIGFSPSGPFTGSSWGRLRNSQQTEGSGGADGLFRRIAEPCRAE